MNTQKDTQKTGLSTYRNEFVQDEKSLFNSGIYEFANKKTEKLLTALYLVSDCMDTDDALKNRIRSLGVELLSDIHKLSILSPIEKHEYINIPLTHINEILSLIEIAFSIGFISEMNTNILKKEFIFLVNDLREKQSQNKHFTFTLDDKMFDVPINNNFTDIKDKRTQFNNMSFIENKSPLLNIKNNKTNITATTIAEREERNNKILSVIKDKKDISIKDISLIITDCSEKTIQRELNSLVSKGKIKKIGSKRWSRYSII